MASYNRIKSAQQAPVGTIMPYGGASGSNDADGVPPGWIVLNGSQTNLNAAEYPMLANIIGNVYGPFPSSAQEEIGLNIGIIFESNGGRGFPYNPPSGFPGHIEGKPVDKFNLPNLNQIPLVDIEKTRISDTSEYSAGDPSANPPIAADHRYDTLSELGEYLSPNGSSGKQAPDQNKSNIDLVFEVESNSNLAGRVTGIVMEAPIYSTTAYVIPRKLGIDHTPRHTHRAASERDEDQFLSAYPDANPVLEWMPGKAIRANSDTQTQSVGAASWRSDTAPAQIFNPGYGQFTWYDADDNGTSMVETNRQWNIGTDTDGDGDIDTKKKTPDTDVYPSTSAPSRVIPQYNQIRNQYTDDYSAVAEVAADAHVGAFPPPGNYNGRRNYYASPDINRTHRGAQMPMTYINDMAYTGLQPTNTNVPATVGNTYSTTLNHAQEVWAGDMRSHNHDAMEITMGSGLSIPATLLINNISTGSTNPTTQETALTVAVNPNTPSLTMMYIMRAF